MSEYKTMRVGLVGAGGIGETHFEALRRVGGVDVVALCRRDKAAAEDYARRYGVRKVYSDYRDLIHDPEVEVVQICTPNHLHYEQVMTALQAGKHVVCDKPLGVNTRQTYEMWSTARSKRVVHAVSYNHRFLPLIFQIREMVKRGDLGKLTLIRGYILDDFMMAISKIAPDHWRTSPETVGLSKTMSTMGGHLIDLIQFTTGLRIKEVLADFGYIDVSRPPIEFDGVDFVRGTDGQLEDHASLLVRFGDGVKGSIVLSEAAPGHKVEVFLELIGTEKCVAWNLQKINEMWIGVRDEPGRLLYKGAEFLYPQAEAVAPHPTWGQDGFSDSFRMFCDSVYSFIRDGKCVEDVRPDFATFEDGHYMELILQAMINSAREERWQKIENRGT